MALGIQTKTNTTKLRLLRIRIVVWANKNNEDKKENNHHLFLELKSHLLSMRTIQNDTL